MPAPIVQITLLNRPIFISSNVDERIGAGGSNKK
tara:strand:- start:2716 stop:2817 length:102 start_codon:yes stop_codon:yes gene_type:complete